MSTQAIAKFRLKANTAFGEHVKIVGNIKELGLWNPTHGIELYTDSNQYPYWDSPKLYLPMNETIEYKYIICQSNSYRWENHQNRKIRISQTEISIEDDEKTSISKINYPLNYQAEYLFSENVQFTKSDSIIIASFTLPITVNKKPNGEWEFELTKGVWQNQLYTTMEKSGIDFLWIGLPGIHIESEKEQDQLSEIMKKKYNCIPIFTNKEDIEQHEMFFSSILLRLLHNITDISFNTEIKNSDQMWNGYKRVNICFADAILQYYTDQIIWIHGSQLFLVSSFVSRRASEILNIGFFLHHPFPSSEIYRLFPHREAILHALCCCDLIGFHLFEYAKNFFSVFKKVETY